jgi:hypothetical protein
MAAELIRRGLRLVAPARPALPAQPPLPASSAQSDLLRFEDTPAFRRVVRLSLGAAGDMADELGKWLYLWLLERGCWPRGSLLHSCLSAAGSELRFIAELLAMREQGPLCRQVLACVDAISQGLGEEIPQATRGAVRDTMLVHLIDLEARDAFETIGLDLWGWAVQQETFGAQVVPGAAADLHILADYLDNLAQLAAEPLAPSDRHLANLPYAMAFEVGQLAADLEGLKETP